MAPAAFLRGVGTIIVPPVQQWQPGRGQMAWFPILVLLLNRGISLDNSF